jgi:hypothetical protein
MNMRSGLTFFASPPPSIRRIESVVRTEFSRLRQRLKEYYADEGRRDPIVIDFPPRSYAASFEFRDAAVFPEPAGAPQLVHPKAQPARRLLRRGAVLIVPCIAAIAVAGVMLWRQHVSPAASKLPIHAIVVLPFENYSPDHQDEYVADGMS